MSDEARREAERSTALEADAVAFFARRYAGVVAREALWRHAGGEASEVAHDVSPARAWQEAWRRAVEGGRGVSPVTLLREALFDRPGDPEALRLLALATSNALAEEAGVVVDLVADAAFSATPEAVRAALWSFPRVDRDAAFAALTLAFASRVSNARRRALEEAAAKVPRPFETERAHGALAGSAAEVAARVLHVVDAYGWTRCTVAVVVSAAMLRRFGGSSPPDEEVLAELARLADDLVPTTPSEATPWFAAHVAATRNILERVLDLTLPGPLEADDASVAAFAQCLFATRGEDDDELDEDDAGPLDDEPPPPPPPVRTKAA
ncbi:MAG: hypothetical protein U0324_18775 [Polyangiales bacterium]